LNFISGKHVFMASTAMAVATFLVVAGERATSAAQAPAAPAAPAAQSAPQTPPAAQAQAPAKAADNDAKGERILNLACGGCHDLRPVQASAHDKEGWNEVVQNMLQKGADVSDADLPILLDYLVEHHGPMPDGRGKDVVLSVCTQCHDLTRIKRGRRSPEEWEETLNAMLNEGAPLSDRDYPIVLQYLSNNFAH
jgi:cytochrome c5